MRLVRIAFIAAVALGQLAVLTPGRAQDDFFPPAVYDPEIPTPEDYFGHEIGDILIRYDQVMGYLDLLASRSDRMEIQTIGYSHERRPIKLLMVTSPTNFSRIDAIKKAHISLSDRSLASEVGADMPVVTWLNYGVHGDEISGIETVIGVAYFLAAVQGPEWERILRESVILNVATFNPDGRDRSAIWYNMHNAKVPVADKAHREHSIPWPGGRTNHYWFDLNRQWLPLTQPEAQAWIKVYHDWKPNVVVDFHEMGSERTYYFHPGEAGRTYPLVPASSERLLERLSQYPASQLDSENRPYFTNEVFDNYYIGKGSTYPLMTGGVGILFEQSGSEGITIESGNGPQFYRENIRQHMNSGLAVVRGAHEMRLDFLNHQKAFYEATAQAAQSAQDKAYLVAAPGDAKRMEAFLMMLKRHRIDAYALSRDTDGFKAGEAFVIPADQNQHRLIRGIFDRLTEFPRDSFYDISGWTLPFAYGLKFKALSRRAANLIGPRWEEPAFKAVSPEEGAVGYVLDWRGYYAPRALYRLLDAGVLVRATTLSMTVDTPAGQVSFDPGALVVTTGNNDGAVAAKLPELLETIAREDGVMSYAVTQGLTPVGPDLGGASQIALKKPRIAMMTGEGIGVYDAGELWYLLDHQMETPVTMRDGQDFDTLDLHRYSHVIIPDGTPPLNEQMTLKLRNWVASGGTLIATQRSAHWAATNGFGTAVTLPADNEEEEPKRFAFAEQSEREARDRIAGAVFATDMDLTHPVAFGIGLQDMPVHRDMETVFEKHQNPYATVAAYKADALISGYASPENRERMAGTPAIIAERFDRGSVVLFADNPAFRGYWMGTHKLVMNAIYFSKGF